MIQVTPTLTLDDSELQFDYIRASGPGGQNVNKVATAVQLRYNSAALPDEIKNRLYNLAASRITAEGVLIIEAKAHRTQEQNRAEAIARLVALLRAASYKPRPRKPTRPSAAAQQRRVEAKRQRGQTKQMRRAPHPGLED